MGREEGKQGEDNGQWEGYKEGVTGPRNGIRMERVGGWIGTEEGWRKGREGKALGRKVDKQGEDNSGHWEQSKETPDKDMG